VDASRRKNRGQRLRMNARYRPADQRPSPAIAAGREAATGPIHSWTETNTLSHHHLAAESWWGERYTQADPLWEVQRRSSFQGPYGYAELNPFLYVDVFGLSVCDGYSAYFGTSCCRDGALQEDTYPRRAQSVCLEFMRMYESRMVVKCVAICLVDEEATTITLADCAARNAERLRDHVKCYAKCGFLPYKGLPPGGPEIGYEELWPDFWDEVWPFGNDDE
jgi:hypothetical protein